jgi:hypothetical protein
MIKVDATSLLTACSHRTTTAQRIPTGFAVQVSSEVVVTLEAFVSIGEKVVKHKELNPTAEAWETDYIQHAQQWMTSIMTYLAACPQDESSRDLRSFEEGLQLLQVLTHVWLGCF